MLVKWGFDEKIEKKCQKIFTGHEPSYGRVVLMSEFDVQKEVEEAERKGNDCEMK